MVLLKRPDLYVMFKTIKDSYENINIIINYCIINIINIKILKCIISLMILETINSGQVWWLYNLIQCRV